MTFSNAFAAPLTMTYDSSIPALYDYVKLSLDGSKETVYAGQLGVSFNNGTTGLLFCADPFVDLRNGAVEVTAKSASDVANGNRLAWMFNNFAGMLTQDWHAAAFQMAAWDIVVDNGDGFRNGDVQKTNGTNLASLTLASYMIAESAGKSGTGITFYVPVRGTGYSQTLFGASTGSDVPEPSTYLLMGAGLIAICQWRRRRGN